MQRGSKLYRFVEPVPVFRTNPFLVISHDGWHLRRTAEGIFRDLPSMPRISYVRCWLIRVVLSWGRWRLADTSTSVAVHAAFPTSPGFVRPPRYTPPLPARPPTTPPSITKRYQDYPSRLSSPWVNRYDTTLWLHPVPDPGSAAVEELSVAVEDHDACTRHDAEVLSVAIKHVTFDALGSVAKLFVEEFFGYTLWFPAQYLAELNRLQMNYHSINQECRHLMLVATSSSDGSLAGFVDIDGRTKRRGQGKGSLPGFLDLPCLPFRHLILCL